MDPNSESFGIEVVQTDGVAVIRLSGELDLATAPQLHETFIKLMNQGVHAVSVDLAGLDFIDSTGLGILVFALKRLRENGGELVLRSLTPSARKVFDLTGLSKVFAII